MFSCKREWSAKSNGKLPHLFIPGNTATLVPEFAAKRPAFGPNCDLGSCVCSERYALGQNTLLMMMMRDSDDVSDFCLRKYLINLVSHLQRGAEVKDVRE